MDSLCHPCITTAHLSYSFLYRLVRYYWHYYGDGSIRIGEFQLPANPFATYRWDNLTHRRIQVDWWLVSMVCCNGLPHLPMVFLLPTWIKRKTQRSSRILVKFGLPPSNFWVLFFNHYALFKGSLVRKNPSSPSCQPHHHANHPPSSSWEVSAWIHGWKHYRARNRVFFWVKWLPGSPK